MNINELSLNEKKALLKNIYTTKSYFETLYERDHIDFDCTHLTLLFREQIERLLFEKKLIAQKIKLENLHEVLSDEMRAYNFNDGVNKISTYFYDNDQQFLNVYYQFIKFLRENFLQEAFWFQATPTLRIHCPNGENSHHYPRYHSDISYGHPPEEINIWLPLTDLISTHCFKIMSLQNSNDTLAKFDYNFDDLIQSAIHDKSFSNYCSELSSPVTTALGKFRAFDSRCIHSGYPLQTHTRISMDIRIVPLKQYEKMTIQYQGSGRRKILFAPGHCYHEQHSDYFLENRII